MKGIAHVLVVAASRGPLLEGETAPVIKIETHLPRVLRRPLVVLAPAVRARLEDVSFRQLLVALVLERALEEGQLDLLAVELARLRAELHVAQLVAVRARPAAVAPRPHDETVLKPRVLLLNRSVSV